MNLQLSTLDYDVSPSQSFIIKTTTVVIDLNSLYHKLSKMWLSPMLIWNYHLTGLGSITCECN